MLFLCGGANVGGGTSEHNQHLETEALHDEAKQDGAPRHPPGLTQKKQQRQKKHENGHVQHLRC